MDGVDPDDDAYPPAPVPRHERSWRHPSEVGDASWRRNEPPLAIGRGLLITTGAIGSLLALAVVWAMLPTATRGGPQALTTDAIRTTRSAASSVRQSVTAASTTTSAAPRSTTAPATTAPSATTVKPRADVTRPDEPTSEADATDPPDTAMPTDDGSTPETVPQATIAVSASADAAAGTAISVMIGGQPVVLTTAGAVRGVEDTVTLAYDDGTTGTATVTMTINGLAVLAPDDTAAAATFKVAGSPHDGDTVTVLGATPAEVPLQVDADGNLDVAWWGSADVAEGTPVVDGDGKVVALCSKSSNGPKLVAVDQRTLRNAVDSTQSTATGSTKPAKAYLGVQLNADPSGSLTIAAVDPNGPAAAAGVVAGDTVVSVDGTALATSDDLFDVLAEHHPDDAVTVTVEHQDGSQVTLDVSLAAHPASA